MVSIIFVGMINFVLNCRGGRVSDKCIIINFGFFYLIEFYDSVMVDKGFSSFIEVLIFYYVNLFVLLGKYGIV